VGLDYEVEETSMLFREKKKKETKRKENLTLQNFSHGLSGV
jgi:hypothetical protein